jgi:deoxyribodipyrimidine photo-lyase
VVNRTNIVIVNGALRLTDNALLEGLSGPTIFMFVLTPYYFSKSKYTGIPAVGENRFKYLFSCIDRFKVQLKESYNTELLVLEGTYKQAIDQVIEYFVNCNVTVLHQPYSYEKKYEQELLSSSYNKLNNSVTVVREGATLIPYKLLFDIYSKNKGGTFSSLFNACLREQSSIKLYETPTNLTPVVVDIKSTTSIAHNVNFTYDFDSVVNYSTNKSLVTGGSTTKIEAALSHGTLSKTMAYGISLNIKGSADDDKLQFIRSLIWNDYCWIIAEVEGDIIFTKDGITKNLNKTKLDVLPDFVKGTGPQVKFYNKAMAKLRATGYLPNRVRMLIGYYVVKVMGYSHLALAEYFEHYLCGFNPHNNWLGAQSCNGTGVDVIPGGRNFNIVNQLTKYDLHKEYL